MEKIMKINGMMCPHCEAAVKTALEKTDGVISALVSFKTGTALLTLEKDVSDEILKAAVENQDFEVVSIS